MITFGPVPSRRLGRSLGINNIPPKICTYSCVYCQLGKTLKMQVEEEVFYKKEKISQDVANKIKEVKKREEIIDYLSFVPDGEPTLDINLGEEIKLLKPLGIKIAVISNASLIWKKNIQDNLQEADWVSMKIDAVTEKIWRMVNRPYRTLKLDKILQGILEFSRIFKGELTTETMLIDNINDTSEEIQKIADFIAKLKPKKSYIAIPIRPPAEKWVKPATESIINMAYQTFIDKSFRTEYLIGYEGDAFASTGNIEDDLLSITSVHPMREEAVKKFLQKAGANWKTIEKLKKEDKLVETKFKEHKFYIRKLIKESSKI